jgi:hypothetical protein
VGSWWSPSFHPVLQWIFQGNLHFADLDNFHLNFSQHHQTFPFSNTHNILCDVLASGSGINVMNYLQLTQTLAESFNALADEVQALIDYKTILEHKLRFAHQQVSFSVSVYASATWLALPLCMMNKSSRSVATSQEVRWWHMETTFTNFLILFTLREPMLSFLLKHTHASC